MSLKVREYFTHWGGYSRRTIKPNLNSPSVAFTIECTSSHQKELRCQALDLARNEKEKIMSTRRKTISDASASFTPHSRNRSRIALQFRMSLFTNRQQLILKLKWLLWVAFRFLIYFGMQTSHVVSAFFFAFSGRRNGNFSFSGCALGSVGSNKCCSLTRKAERQISWEHVENRA